MKIKDNKNINQTGSPTKGTSIITLNISHMNAKEILAKSQAATTSLIQKGTKGRQESIYKASIFEGLTDKEKKSSRLKIRKYTQSLLSSIATAEEGDKLNKLCAEFSNFYLQCYKVNDYTLASICSGNTSETTKKAITDALQKVQNFYTPNRPKDKSKSQDKK